MAGKLPFLPDANIGKTERRVGDKQVSGLGINPQWTYLFSQLPITNYFFNNRAEVKKAQTNMKWGSELAYLGGLRFMDVEQQSQELIRKMEFNEHTQRIIRGLRDEDEIEEREIYTDSPYQRRLGDILTGRQ